MKTLTLPYLSENDISGSPSGMHVWPGVSDKICRIDTINWPLFNYRPEVSFAAACTAEAMYLYFIIKEDYFKAEKTMINDEVYEDSCVEAFIAPANDGIYYNFEFNGIGTCLMGYGKSRHDRKRADPGLIGNIARKTTAGTNPISGIPGPFTWELSVKIPFSVFFLHKITDPAERVFYANFYKCGDKLPVPHYLTWSPVSTPAPDFHRPEHFGRLMFALHR